jgi:CspA family cold shock protein
MQQAYGLGAPIVQNAADIAAGVFVGQCKNWNPDKGWGFITCDVTERIYGKDIFVMRSAVASGSLTPGERVRFTVQSGIKGIEAASVQSEGMGGQTMGMMGGYSSPAAVGPGQGQMFFGVVKGFNEEKGWGHIDCEGSKKLVGKDMFFLRSALNGQAVAPGSQVSFKVAQGQKGPEAAEISVLPPGTIAHAGHPGATFSGSIKIFNEEKGWGFIQGEEVAKTFGKDIFVHSKELSGYTPTVGEEVTFSVIINADGRPEAASVQLGQAAVFKGFQAAPQMTAPGAQHFAPY